MKFEVKDLPKPPKILAFIGPGFILAAFAQGSGELIWWPYLVAKYKDILLWLMPIAFTMQFWVNLEIGRYTLLTGESIIKGFYRISKYALIIIFILNFVSWIWIGGYLSASATAIAELGPFQSKSKSVMFWAYLLLLVFTPALLSKKAYDFIEKLEKFVGIFCFLSFLSVTILCTEVRQTIPSFFKSFFAIHYPSVAPSDYKIFLTALVFAGLGGTANLFYSYWLKEKGVGMAKRGGGIFRLDKKNEYRLKRWVRILWIDNGVGVYLNFLTTVLTALLAYTILASKGLYPKGWDLASVQSEFLATVYGEIGRIAFLLIATFFLADTWVVLVYSLSKINAEVFSLLFGRNEGMWFRIWLYIYILASVLLIPLKKPGYLITLCGVASFLSMTIYTPILAYLTWIYLPKLFRSRKVCPNLFSKIGISTAFVFYLLLFFSYLKAVVFL